MNIEIESNAPWSSPGAPRPDRETSALVYEQNGASDALDVIRRATRKRVSHALRVFSVSHRPGLRSARAAKFRAHAKAPWVTA